MMQNLLTAQNSDFPIRYFGQKSPLIGKSPLKNQEIAVHVPFLIESIMPILLTKLSLNENSHFHNGTANQIHVMVKIEQQFQLSYEV